MRTTTLATFQAIHAANAAALARHHGLTIKSGIVPDCSVIKLLKSHWTTSPQDIMRNDNGVFFSIWLDEQKPAKPLLRTNIHAKKFREAGYPKIAARDFAEAFRRQAARHLETWPNLTYPKGPGSLFEAHQPFVLATVEQNTLAFMHAFLPLAQIIDRLLDP